MDTISQQQPYLSSTFQSTLLTTYTICNQKPIESTRCVSFAKRVSEEEIEQVMHQVPLTQQGESQVIDVWRRYIAQRTAEEGASGQFEAMEKMIQAYWSNEESNNS